MTHLFIRSEESRGLGKGSPTQIDLEGPTGTGKCGICRAHSRTRTQGQTEAELQKNQPKAREGAVAQNEFTLAERQGQETVEPTTQPTPTGVGRQPKKGAGER